MEERGPRGIAPARALAGAIVLVLATAVATYGATASVGGLPVTRQAQTLRLLSEQPNWSNFIGAVTAARQHYVTPLSPQVLNQMVGGAAKGAIAALGDPYSGFFDATDFRQSQVETSGEYAGIGVSVDDKAGKLIVIGVFPGTPAADTAYVGAAAGDPLGLRAGDRFQAIDGRPVAGMPVEEVAKLIQGRAGTTVTVTVTRADRPLVFRFTRRTIVIPTAQAKLLDPGPIGYLQISGFNDRTPDQVAEQIGWLTARHVVGMVLDLRNNPGGVVDDATRVAGDFLGRGLVTYLSFRGGRRIDYRAPGPRLVHVPFVVLVNGYSASAAEIVAGAIQDSGLAPLIGEKTFGKFIVQQIFPLQDGTGVKLTVARYFTPKGRNLEKVGLTPTVAVPYPTGLSPAAFGDPAQDPQLRRALDVLRSRLGGQTGGASSPIASAGATAPDARSSAAVGAAAPAAFLSGPPASFGGLPA